MPRPKLADGTPFGPRGDEDLPTLVRTLLDQLPRCDRCEESATKQCLDNAGDGYVACEAHAGTGRLWGEETPAPPLDLPYAATVRCIRERLG